MMITCLPERLRAALDIARKPIKTNNNPIPVLSHVHLKADDGIVTLTGTDLRWSAIATASAKVEQPGQATLAPKGLADFLAACPDGEPLTIEVSDKHRATLTCGRSSARLVGLDPEEFPPTPVMRGAENLSLPSKVLRSLIERTAFAAAPDESRPVLAGVSFMVRDSKLELAGADGLRMAICAAPVDDDAPSIATVIPAKPLAAVAACLPRDDEPVAIGIDDAHVRFWAGAMTWVIGLIDGQFPDYRRITPKATAMTITCPRDAIRRAVQLARAFEEASDDQHNNRRYHTAIVRLSVADDVMTVRSRSDKGDEEGASEIVVTTTGENAWAAFNGEFLYDAITSLDADEITLEIDGPTKPGIVRAAGERNGHLNVLIAMRVTTP